jgi:hypothetical protein
VNKLVSHPLEDELGFALEQTVRLAFVAEFGFRMEPGLVSWPGDEPGARRERVFAFAEFCVTPGEV